MNEETALSIRFTTYFLSVFCIGLPACKTFPPAKPQPKVQIYATNPAYVEEGIASWYGGKWVGALTASGERYGQGDLTAAHKKLPFNTQARVTDLKSGKSIMVRINNRGPFIKGRIIDLSVAAAKSLGTYNAGLARVRIEVLRPVPLLEAPNLRIKPKPTPTPVENLKKKPVKP